MSLSMTRHSLDVMGPVWCILSVIFYWTSLCVILCTCRVSAMQHCLKNSTDGNRNCTLNGTCTGFPKLPTFPDVRLWPINTTRLIELVEPCLPDINDTDASTPTTPTPTTTAPPGPNALLIVGIVVGCLLAIVAILAGVYYCVRKKHETCKVHSESDLDDKQADGNSLKPAAQGPDSTDKGIDSSPAPPSGGGVIITPHEPDPKESDESRNRTFSTGSRVGDTSILMPTDSAGTSQAEPKKKKEKKKKKKEKKEKKEKKVKKGTKDIELPPVQPKEQAYDQVKTADEVV